MCTGTGTLPRGGTLRSQQCFWHRCDTLGAGDGAFFFVVDLHSMFGRIIVRMLGFLVGFYQVFVNLTFNSRGSINSAPPRSLSDDLSA